MSESSSRTKTAIIFTALDVETRAVLRQLGSNTTENVSGTNFFRGRFLGWDIAVAEVGPGNVRAATIAVRGLEHFKPNVALFVGVAGGVKDVKIGDVVVGTKVYGYESGKDLASGFRSRPDVMTTAHTVEQSARALRQRDDWRKRLDSTISHESPTIYVDPIAAGEKVIASKRAATAKLIKQNYSDALAVEMEGRGFLEGVHINHPVEGGVVRGISDLLSGKASADKEGSQRRAADAASAVAFEILSNLSGQSVRSTPIPAKPVSKFIETPTTFSPSAYFEKGEILARIGVPDVDEVTFSFEAAPDAYLRIIPMQPRERPISLATLREVAGGASILAAPGHGGLTDTNDHGVILHQPLAAYRGGDAPMHRATQLFPNGELWSISDRDVVIREHGDRPLWVPVPLIAALTLEQVFYKALHANISFVANSLGLTFPCAVELGLLGLAKVRLGIQSGDIRGPIRSNEVIVRQILGSADVADINAVLLEFFNEVHDKTGYARPSGLYGFPPGPPKGS